MNRALIFISLLLSSCVTQKRCLERFPPASDTLSIVEIRDTIIFRDTTILIHLPGEILIDSVIIPCPEPAGPFIPDTARAETSLAVAIAWWKYPAIRLRLIQKDTTIERRLRDAIREKIHWQSEYEKITQVQVVKEIPGIYKIAIGGWIGVIILIILIIAVKIFKII
jgi:hypothetical protein